MVKKTTPPQAARTYERFPLARRVEHVIMLLSFTTLGLTGLIQKFSASPVSQFLLSSLGGIERVRSFHHAAAIVLMFGTMYHIILFGYKSYVLRTRLTMLPSLQDAKDALQALLYNIGFGKSRPQMGRFTFEEKAEYWAFVWGTVVMGITGFLMWNPITATKFFSGEYIPAAKAAHGGEAVLAVLAIILWHMYGVHIKFFNKAMWTGRLTEEEMLHEHPLELADIKAGIADLKPDAGTIRKRQMVYFPIASVLTVVMLAGIYGFINTEQTALTTIPPQDNPAEVYVPQTPTPAPTMTPTSAPTNTPIPATPTLGTPAASITWDSQMGAFFAENCSECHINKTNGGLNLATYADVMKGGASGVIIVPGNSAGSLLITKYESGDHSYQTLAPEDLATIKAWIDGGALEK